MREAIEILRRGGHLSAELAEEVVRALTSGSVAPAEARGVLVALREKGETVDEVVGFARGLRALARPARLPAEVVSGAIDIVGTGGDGSGTFNLSTGSALLTAACGLPVVKHGNRAISSRSGAADVLVALGLPVPLDVELGAVCLRETGFVFLFAPHYHPATAQIGPVRRELGGRTIFNMLGPLTNPAQPRFGVFGAYSLGAARLMAGAIARLGSPAACVVLHSDDGTDEPTPASAFTAILVGGVGGAGAGIREMRIEPWTHGLKKCAKEELLGGDAAHNAAALRRVFEGERSAHRDALVLGAGLALWVGERAASLGEGIAQAGRAIDDGRAIGVLEAIAKFGAGVGVARG